jgi:UDP-GlcNAc:undecaprenyl-phosphate GlcNAc-1-phosphate transferase
MFDSAAGPSSLPHPAVAVVTAFAAAAVASGIGTRALIAVGLRAGALDSAGAPGHAKELRRVPNIGGIAVTATVTVAIAAVLTAHALLDPAQSASDPVGGLGHSVRNLANSSAGAWWILGGAAVLHALGLRDDRRAIAAWPKLGVQVAVALSVAGAGGFRALHLLDPMVGGPWLSIAISACFIVALTNAVNFLDNMDGLAGGVSAIAAASLAVAAGIAGQWATSGLLAVLCGALLGFLAFNFPWRSGSSARIFLGDGGSLPVGFLLAVLAMQVTFTSPGEPGYALGTRWYGVLAPLVILAVPLYDACTVSGLRMLQGRSPMVGDQQHFSHRLVMRGLTRRGAVLLICAIAACCGIAGLLLGTAAPWQASLIGVQVAVFMATLAALERPMLGRLAGERR